MNTYSGPEYKNLYEEILKDYYYRFPKFSPIPYPMLERIRQQSIKNEKDN